MNKKVLIFCIKIGYCKPALEGEGLLLGEIGSSIGSSFFGVEGLEISKII